CRGGAGRGGTDQPGDGDNAGFARRIPHLVRGGAGQDVACAGDHDDVVVDGVAHGVGEDVAAELAAEGQVDHGGAVGDGPADAVGDDGRVVVAVVLVEHPDGEDLRLRGDPDDAVGVVAAPRDEAGDGRAVADRVAAPVGRAVDEVGAGEHLAGEVGVRRVDAR